MNRWQQEELFKGIAGLFTPETRSDATAEENRLIKLCCKGSSFKDEKDDEFAEQLDMLLTAAKARGKPLNLKITSTSGATLLVMAALSNGVERVRVLLKHGEAVAADQSCSCRGYTASCAIRKDTILHDLSYDVGRRIQCCCRCRSECFDTSTGDSSAHSSKVSSTALTQPRHNRARAPHCNVHLLQPKAADYTTRSSIKSTTSHPGVIYLDIS